MYRIKFIREEKEILVEPGTRILEAERKAKLVPDAPCGGRGKCGKCRVKIEDHMVLACQTEIHSDLEVDTLSGCQEEEILTEGMQRPVAFRPDLKQKKVILEKPETGDNRSEWERLTEQLDVEKPVLPDTEIASKLYGCRKEAAAFRPGFYFPLLSEADPFKKRKTGDRLRCFRGTLQRS